MTHFEDMTLFAALVSLALAFLTKRTMIERVKYGIYAFLGFLLVAIAIGWLMYPLSH